MGWTDTVDDRWQIHLTENKGQAGTHNLPGNRENQVSPTTTISDNRWKETQERTGPPENLVREGPAGPMKTSRAGNTVLMRHATNTGGKKWTPDTTQDKWEKKVPGQRTTGGNKETEEP